MATLEAEEPIIHTTRVELVNRKLIDASRSLTGTDERLTPLDALSLMGLALTVTFAPTPWNVVGAISLVLVVLSLARLAWRKKP